MTAADLAARLGAKRTGDSWMACCPAHEDSTPSLSIAEGRDGRTLITCHAGCRFDAIVAALGVDARELFSDAGHSSRREVATYVYQDEHGTPLFEVVRFDPKGFAQRRPNGEWGVNGVPRVLYRLPQLRAAVAAGQRVFICEGEKDVHAVEAAGYAATCNPGGAGKWRPEFTETLRGADVVIIADADEPGRKHARVVAAALHGIATRVEIREPAAGKDVSDHLVAGKTVSELEQVALEEPAPAVPRGPGPVTAPVKPPQFDTVDAALLKRLAVRNAAPVDAVPTPFAKWNAACRDQGGGEGLARGWHVVIAGATGAGKSIVGLNVTARAIRAGERVCYISLEMSQEQLVTRLVAILTGTSICHLEPGRLFRPDVARTAHAEFVETLERTGGSVRVNRHPLRNLSDIDLAFAWYTDREICTVFITDYLQLAWVGGAKSMLENITEVSHAIRARAREAGVVSLGLSQLNRQTTSNRGERPRVEGLMGGSPLENDSDQVLLLDHTSYERHATTARTTLLLAKNRHGPQLEIPVRWDYGTLQVREEGPGEDDAHGHGRGDAFEPEDPVS